MDISRARPEDAAVLSRIAVMAKAHWGYPPEWMERWAAALTLTPEYIERYSVYSAILDGEIAAFYALVPQGPVCLLDHLWVRPDHLREGIGRLLFRDALARAASLGASRMELEAEPNAVGFYNRMGARYLRDTISDFGRILPIMGIDLNLPLRTRHSSGDDAGGGGREDGQ